MCWGSCVKDDLSYCELDEEGPEWGLRGSVSPTPVMCPLRLPKTCCIISSSLTAGGADELDPADCVLCVILAPSNWDCKIR